jgi:hypothetical protein
MQKEKDKQALLSKRNYKEIVAVDMIQAYPDKSVPTTSDDVI